jgi:hypothetical protein
VIRICITDTKADPKSLVFCSEDESNGTTVTLGMVSSDNRGNGREEEGNRKKMAVGCKKCQSESQGSKIIRVAGYILLRCRKVLDHFGCSSIYSAISILFEDSRFCFDLVDTILPHIFNHGFILLNMHNCIQSPASRMLILTISLEWEGWGIQCKAVSETTNR